MKIHADCGSLTDRVGLTAALKGVLSDLRIRRGRHEPGQVLRNLGVMPTDGGDALCYLGALHDQEVLFGAVRSDATAWVAAFDSKGGERDEAWVAELALDLTATDWPSDTRAICRRERPHPGAQLSFTDSDGYRFQIFITNQKGGRIARLEQIHRSRAAIEDSIRCAKASGLRNLPFRAFAYNAAWLELVLLGCDLVAFMKTLLLEGELATLEPKRLCYRLLCVAGRIVSHARYLTLRLPRGWPWADGLIGAFARLHVLPLPAG